MPAASQDAPARVQIARVVRALRRDRAWTQAELARAIAEPLGRTDKITIISNGGEGVGASKLTKDVVDIIAQLPPVLEGVSGVNLKDLISKIPGVGKKDAASTR